MDRWVGRHTGTDRHASGQAGDTQRKCLSTGRQAGRQAERMTDRQTHTDRQTNRHILAT